MDQDRENIGDVTNADARYGIQDSWIQDWTLKYLPVSLILVIRHLVSRIWYLVSGILYQKP